MEKENNKIETKDIRIIISTLWVVVMFNMAFADILTFITPGVMADIVSGNMDVTITPLIMLVFALLIEIPIAMIFLSRILKAKANRICNIIASILTILFVVGGGSLYIHYIIFASVEVIAMMAIIVLSRKL
ncbi:MAG: DUF6326 family protein [Spirochaetaceae bacterium]|jgi:hypothetical protein|nr:DUF6326 family protein [Spirochaetaceae bacterium]